MDAWLLLKLQGGMCSCDYMHSDGHITDRNKATVAAGMIETLQSRSMTEGVEQACEKGDMQTVLLMVTKPAYQRAPGDAVRGWSYW